jgi:hypothetical protein
MIDTKPQVTAFIRSNFKSSTLEHATHKLSSSALLSLLFNVFPKDSIDDYDLFDILTTLGYKPLKQSSTSEAEEETLYISFVWCLEEIE